MIVLILFHMIGIAICMQMYKKTYFIIYSVLVPFDYVYVLCRVCMYA
jgi:hypothetical protein